MSTESSITSSLAGASKWLTAGTLGFTALLGTTWMIGSGEPSPKGSPAVVVGAQHVPSDAGRERHHVLRMRAPLNDFFGIEVDTGDDTPAAPWYASLGRLPYKSATNVWALPKKLEADLRTYDLEYLIMTVADPIDSVNNSFFDHQLDALQKALVANPQDSWLYSGGYLPWQAFKDQRSADSKVPLLRKKHWYQDEPGVLLFRKEHHENCQRCTEDQGRQNDHLLVVYLVGEMPTLGIQRDALDHAIHDVAILSQRIGSIHKGKAVPLAIVGPSFTGSAYSLKQGLMAAKVKAARKPEDDGYDFDFDPQIINGSATAIGAHYFDGIGTGQHGQTVCDWTFAFNALAGVAGTQRIVWLTETGTSLSSTFSSEPRMNDLYIPVPLGISRVRGTFEKQLTAAKQQSIGMPLIQATSPLPFDVDETARDMPPGDPDDAPLRELLDGHAHEDELLERELLDDHGNDHELLDDDELLDEENGHQKLLDELIGLPISRQVLPRDEFSPSRLFNHKASSPQFLC